jgi:hypothetical protein
MASTAKNNFILSLSKDEAAAPAAVKTDRIGQAGNCNRFICSLGAGKSSWRLLCSRAHGVGRSAAVQ